MQPSDIGSYTGPNDALARGQTVEVPAGLVTVGVGLVMAGRTLCEIRTSLTTIGTYTIESDGSYRLGQIYRTTLAKDGHVFLVPLVTE